MTSTLEPVTVERAIARIIRDELLLGSEREIPFDQPLGELGVGLDSLALVNLLSAVEAAFRVELSDDIWTERGPLSVNDLAEIVRSTRPAAAPTLSAQGDSAALHGRMEQLEQRLRRRGSAGRAAWAAIRMAAPARRFLFARTQHVLLERRLDEEISTEIAPPLGIEFRPLLPGERPDLSDLWAPVHARRMTKVFQREVDRGAIALVASVGHRVVAVDLLSGSGGLDVEVNSPGVCFGFLLAEARAARGRGIGRALIEEVSAWSGAQGGQFLQVKTIAASHPSPEYAQTRAFYESVGFVPLEVFPTLWTARHPCLQLVKRLHDVAEPAPDRIA